MPTTLAANAMRADFIMEHSTSLVWKLNLVEAKRGPPLGLLRLAGLRTKHYLMPLPTRRLACFSLSLHSHRSETFPLARIRHDRMFTRDLLTIQ